MVRLKAADPKAPETNPIKRGRMTAITAAPIESWFGTLRFDLTGMGFTKPRIGILEEHDRASRIGFADETDMELAEDGKSVDVEFTFLDNEKSLTLQSDMKQGFPMESSIGVDWEMKHEINLAEGETDECNGDTLHGPCTIIRQSKLKEISAVTLGRDDNTQTELLAKNQPKQEDAPMPAKLAELKEAFPDNSDLVIEALTDGLTVSEAKAREYDRLKVNLAAETQIQEGEIVRLKQALELSKAARRGPAPVPTVPQETLDAAKPKPTPTPNHVDLSTLTSEEAQIKQHWAQDAQTRDDFCGKFEMYAAYARAEMKANDPRTIHKIYGHKDTRVITQHLVG